MFNHEFWKALYFEPRILNNDILTVAYLEMVLLNTPTNKTNPKHMFE